MASQIIAEQLREFREIFELFDEDKDGFLNMSEFKALLLALGQTPNDRELMRLICFSENVATRIRDLKDMRESMQGVVSADEMAGISLDFSDFLCVMSRRVRDSDLDEEMIQAFKVFDVNGDGLISHIELLAKMRSHGEELTAEEAAEMVREADLDGDGMINFDEFVKMMTGAGQKRA